MKTNKKILIIDDEKNNVELAKDLLELAGFKVFVAYDGSEGIKTALETIPDVILLDIQMPVINGFQVYNELMKDELTRNVKVIFFTASIMGTDKEELEKLKCPAILKPIDTRSFINLINGFI